MDIIDVCPRTSKAKSRIGHTRPAVIEQRYPERIFVAFVGINYCCWMPPDGGKDWLIFDGTEENED